MPAFFSRLLTFSSVSLFSLRVFLFFRHRYCASFILSGRYRGLASIAHSHTSKTSRKICQPLRRGFALPCWCSWPLEAREVSPSSMKACSQEEKLLWQRFGAVMTQDPSDNLRSAQRRCRLQSRNALDKSLNNTASRVRLVDESGCEERPWGHEKRSPDVRSGLLRLCRSLHGRCGLGTLCTTKPKPSRIKAILISPQPEEHLTRDQKRGLD